jgi:hypothetical protein
MSPPRTWIVTDGAAGNERQAEALAAAMGLAPWRFRVRLAAPWSWFAPRLTLGAARALPPALRVAAASEPPELVIGCGRRAALALGWLRRRVHAYTVQILDPRVDPRRFDLVITPAHDALRADNVLTTIGALNAITPARLAAAAIEHAALATLPAPRNVVLIGGSTRAQRIDARYVDGLLERLGGWHALEGGSFLVSTSRRTPAALARRLREAFARWPGRIWTGADDGRNPYLGFLAHAQRIVVTPDSVNLLSEACATGRPVYTYAPRPIRGKLAEFHRELAAGGRLRALGREPDPYRPEPLHETEAVAEEVWRRFRGWRSARSGAA